MTTEQIVWTIVSSLLSGLLGVIVSTVYYRRHEARKVKFTTFRSLMANRFDLNSEGFTKAINEIAIVFNDSKPVCKALTEYHLSLGTTQADDAFLKLFKSIARDLNLSMSDFNDSFLFKPFNAVTKASENKLRCHEIFKTLMATRAATVSPEHVKALNMITIEFPEVFFPDVIKLWKVYFDHLHNYPENGTELQQIWTEKSTEHLGNLLKAMGDGLGYSFDIVDIKKGIYAPKAHELLELEQKLFRQGVVQLLYGERSLKTEVVRTSPDPELSNT
ncbi:TPA: hypothetical protein NG287_004516 [Vibrio parahaemolyticus]|nr:hypothetical protein [Vibrio parahaemolyticus]HCG7352047.1 hypothetical protein [Vibrio parahaemolyticus]